jgi:hypothetical protein
MPLLGSFLEWNICRFVYSNERGERFITSNSRTCPGIRSGYLHKAEPAARGGNIAVLTLDVLKQIQTMGRGLLS